MNIGVFGGTFDPIHLGHLIVAEEARVSLDLDEVLFLPTGQPYFKADRTISEASHRLAMVELAVESNPYFRASDMEIKRPGPTYTVDTLVELRSRVGPKAEIYVILGLDSLGELDRWHEPRRILEMSTVVGVSRPGFQELDARVLDSIRTGASTEVVLLNGPLIGVSGSEIRRRVSEGLSIRYHAPEAVERYIYDHGLYGGRHE